LFTCSFLRTCYPYWHLCERGLRQVRVTSSRHVVRTSTNA